MEFGQFYYYYLLVVNGINEIIINDFFMEFLYKPVLFVLFGINILFMLFCILNFFDCVFDPYKKLSEAIIILLGAIIVSIGLFFAYQYGYSAAEFLKGVLILIAGFVFALVWIIVGLLFFNGPLHWQ